LGRKTKNVMNNKEFIQRGAIAALQGIISSNGTSCNVEQRAVVHAEVLLHIINQREYSLDDNWDVRDCIADVDNTHGEIEREILKKIEYLEYMLENHKRIIETNCPGWINK